MDPIERAVIWLLLGILWVKAFFTRREETDV